MKTLKEQFKISLFLLSGIFITCVFISCTKEVPREMVNQKNQQVQPNPTPEQQKMPDDDIHRNLQQNTQGSIDTLKSGGELKGDPKAEELSKAADEADAQYQKTRSDADKKTCVSKQLAAANYLMFEANLSPKKKYRPALQRYRRVLELDPSNKEAAENKQQIEEIYQSMGMPVPN